STPSNFGLETSRWLRRREGDTRNFLPNELVVFLKFIPILPIFKMILTHRIVAMQPLLGHIVRAIERFFAVTMREQTQFRFETVYVVFPAVSFIARPPRRLHLL